MLNGSKYFISGVDEASHPLSAAAIDLELSRPMTTKAAWLHDNGRPAGEASNMAKYAAADVALKSLDAAIQTHGGNGLASEFGLAHLWGMARLLKIAAVRCPRSTLAPRWHSSMHDLSSMSVCGSLARCDSADRHPERRDQAPTDT